MEFDLPTLWVSGDNFGGCTRNRFRFRRDGADGALRISTSDDMPGGSGRASRASLWQAAVTAAVLRDNPLTGVRIEYEYKGLVDGPSAGSVFCLAMLSALDGRDFPDDFAMTGTIMPDGTVGAVGGVVHKLRGAKRAGIRRVCIPAVVRFETEEDGSLVDLVAEARELGLELHLVHNVEEAYAILHKLPPPLAEQVVDSDIYTEPERQEKALFGAIREIVSETQECKRKMETLLRDDDLGETIAKLANLMLEHYPIPDWENSLRAGMLHVAFQQAGEELSIWQGIFRLAERLGDILEDYDLTTPKGYERWERDIQRNLSDVKKRIAGLEDEWVRNAADDGGRSALQAQCVSVNWWSEVHNFNLRTAVPIPSQREIDEDEDDDFFGMALLKEVVCAHHGIFFETVNGGWRELAGTLPPARAKCPPKQVESLFYAAQSALAEELDDAYGKWTDALQERFFDWSLYDLKRQEAKQYHALAVALDAEGKPGAEFAMVMSAMSQADALAHGFMAKTMVSPDIGPQEDDEGGFSCKNHFFLSYLLRSSRVQAVRALSACVSAGIPCPRIRYHVEQGDYHRDDDGFDRFDVLREYWCAMLQAKALRMLF